MKNMKRLLAVLAAAITLGGCTLFNKGGSAPETGITEDGELLIVYSSDGLMSEYKLIGDEVITEGDMFFDEEAVDYVGRRFKPVSEGECSMIFRIKEYDSGNITETQVFDIKVDADMKISYDSRETQLLPLSDILNAADSVQVVCDGLFSVYGKDTAAIISQEASLLFGSWESCSAEDADTEAMNYISAECIDDMDVRYEYEFWFGDGNTAYSCQSNDNGLEEWSVYTLDPVSRFDDMLYLLDALEGIQTFG